MQVIVVKVRIKRMKSNQSMVWQGCPIRYTAGIVGDKWNLLLIRDLLFKGRRHFGDFLDADECISSNILSNRLARLVESGIVAKTQDVNHGKKYVYVLTDKGIDLLPMMIEMLKWAQRYDEETFVSQSYIAKLSSAPKQFQKDIVKSMKAIDSEVLAKKSDGN